MATQQPTLDDKAEQEHIETTEVDRKLDPDVFVADNFGELSKQHALGFRQTIFQFRKALLICVGVAICAMGDGYQYKMPGNIVALRGFINQMGFPTGPGGTYVLNPQHVAAWGGVYSGAQIAVLMVGSWPMDHLGRRFMLVMTQVFMLIALIIELFATNWTHWLAAKILNGLSVGCNQFAATSYISEIAPTRVRGAALGLYQLAWALGSFAAAVGLQIVSTMPTEQWRHAIYSMAVFLGLAFIVLIFVPESPRFYAIKGKHDLARKMMQKIYGGVDGYDIEHEYNIILKEIEDGRILVNKQKDANLLDCFRGTNLRRTIISVTPFTLQLWLGSPIVFTYTSYFFSLAGLAQPFMATVAVNTVLVVSVMTSLYSTERFGRRPLLLCMGVLMVPLLFGMGGVLKAPLSPATGSALIALACIWVAAYASSIGPLGYVFLAECSTVLLRAKTTNMAALGTALFSLVTSYSVPIMLASPSFGVANTMFFFGSTGFLSVVFIYFIIPETKNRSFVELDELFAQRVPARHFSTFETSIDRAKKAGATQDA